jgi:hypothetical protein
VEGAPLGAVVTLLAGALPEGEATLTNAAGFRPGFQVGGDAEEAEEQAAADGEPAPEGVDAAEAAQDLLPARPPEVDPFSVLPSVPKAEKGEEKADGEEAGGADQDEVFAQAVRLLRRQGSETAEAPPDLPCPGERAVNAQAEGPMAPPAWDALSVDGRPEGTSGEWNIEDQALGFLAALGLAWWSGRPSGCRRSGGGSSGVSRWRRTWPCAG